MKYWNLLFACFLCTFVACSNDHESDYINEGRDNTTDVAVTGAVFSKGLTHAEIYGYANLNQLPSSVSKKRMGVEYWEEDESNAKMSSTDNLEDGNRIEISLQHLTPGVTYTYRTFVTSSDGTNYYGKKKNFTLSNEFNNIVSFYEVKDIYTAEATIIYNLDTLKMVSDETDAKMTEIGIIYSPDSCKLSKDSLYKAVNKVLGSYNWIIRNAGKNTYTLEGNYETTYYYSFYTRLDGVYVLGPIQKISFEKVDLSEVVDLGLSVKWATCNLGASKPYEYGNYYKWGETTPADDKGWKTYKYAKGSYDKLTKYCSDEGYGYNGFTDGKNRLEPMDDAATVNLGGKWRMPTSDEIYELIDKCKREWTTFNGVNGIRVTGPNGISIFFPASGYRLNYDGSLYGVGVGGYYWSATPRSRYDGYYLNFYSSNWGMDYNFSRANGFPVRPVLSE